MVWGKNVISSFLEHFAAIFAASVTPFISTVWVLRQIRNSDEMHLVRQLTQNGVHLSVREILADNHLIQSFMDHLIHEFSAENLLALIEFQQFRIHLMDKYGSKVFVPDTTDGDDVVLELAETVPKSDIVYSPTVLGFNIRSKKSLSNLSTKSASNSKLKGVLVQTSSDQPNGVNSNTDNGTGGELQMTEQQSERFDALNAFQIKALQLYNKYVRRGAEFQINLSFDVHHSLDSFMLSMVKDHIMTGSTEMNPVELAFVFDHAMKELLLLLNDSKSRFNCQKLKLESNSTL